MDRPSAEAITRRIQDSIDIVELIGEHVALKRRGASYVGLCPFHQEKTPSFNVNPAKRFFKCFGCGVGGDVFTFVQLWDKVGFREAREILARRAGIELEASPRAQQPQGSSRSVLYRANEWASGQFRAWLENERLGEAARDYIKTRRLAPPVVEEFNLGFAPATWDSIERAGSAAGFDSKVLAAAGLIRPRSAGGGFHDTFHNRLMFPILDSSGQPIGFGGRTLGDDRAKYLNTPETLIFDKGRQLYGLAAARQAIAERGRAVVVEGYTDCMMAHQFGFKEAVATLGTALTQDHVRLLGRFTDNVILIFDSDDAGSRAADRGLEVFLTQQLDVKLVQVPEGKDPCDFLLARGSEEFEQLLNGAQSALEFKWRTISRRYGDASSGPRRREAIDEFLSVVATSAVYRAIDPIQRGLVLNQVGKLLAIQPEELYRQVDRRGRKIVNRAETPSPSPGSPPPAVNAQRPLDVEQLALREILESLINEPGLFHRVDESFRPERLTDANLRAIAAAVVELARELGEFEVRELIARMPDPASARLIIDLQSAGEAKGNHEATIEQACRRLAELRRERETRHAARQVSRKTDELSQQDQDSLLGALQAQASRRKGPLPLKMTSFLESEPSAEVREAPIDPTSP